VQDLFPPNRKNRYGLSERMNEPIDGEKESVTDRDTQQTGARLRDSRCLRGVL